MLTRDQAVKLLQLIQNIPANYYLYCSNLKIWYSKNKLFFIIFLYLLEWPVVGTNEKGRLQYSLATRVNYRTNGANETNAANMIL